MIYDIIIIGAGIAGLYTAYLIRKTSPNLKVLILEKNQKHIGGRMGSELFYGSNVSIGAGVGRLEKDKLLMDLLDELDIPYKKFETNTGESIDLKGQCVVKKLFLMIKRTYNEKRKKGICINQTFKEFALPLLGMSGYANFLACSGYTDYENTDIYDVLYNYGFEDNYDNFTAVGIPWNLLLSKLVKKINPIKIKRNNVTSVEKNEDGNFIIESSNIKKIKIKVTAKASQKFISIKKSFKYFTKKVVFATTVDSLYRLIKNPIYDQIHGQKFLRCYGKFSQSSIPILKKYITSPTMVVKGPLHKIISINPDKGIYMIYADNASAKKLLPYIKNTSINCRLIAILMSNALSSPKIEIESMLGVYWKIGTHYYTPTTEKREDFIYHVQRPLKNMFVVGEMVSLNQGWVEGALESVEQVFDEIL